MTDPHCPRCHSSDVVLHKQEPPARGYYTCNECGKTGTTFQFEPPPVPDPNTIERQHVFAKVAPALALAASTAGEFGPAFDALNGMDRADRGRVK